MRIAFVTVLVLTGFARLVRAHPVEERPPPPPPCCTGEGELPPPPHPYIPPPPPCCGDDVPHPPPCCDGNMRQPPPPPPEPPPLMLPTRTIAARWLFEAQIGGGLGRYAASNETIAGVALGYHHLRTERWTDPSTGARLPRGGDWLLGEERGLDLTLRIDHTRDGAGILVGVRPVLRHIHGDWRTPSLVGALVPELAWSTGSGRLASTRIEWSLPVAISLGSNAIEWDVVRGGAIFAADGAHASFGTQLRFVLR